MKIEERRFRLGDLRPNSYNARFMDDAERAALVRHVRRDGRLVSSLLVRPDGTIVDGEQRWRAAVEALGEDAEAHCFVVSKEAERQYRERTLAMNRVVGRDDPLALSSLLADLAGLDAGGLLPGDLAGWEPPADLLEATGYGGDEILESLRRLVVDEPDVSPPGPGAAGMSVSFSVRPEDEGDVKDALGALSDVAPDARLGELCRAFLGARKGAKKPRAGRKAGRVGRR